MTHWTKSVLPQRLAIIIIIILMYYYYYYYYFYIFVFHFPLQTLSFELLNFLSNYPTVAEPQVGGAPLSGGVGG
jgi:hypothetical protein